MDGGRSGGLPGAAVESLADGLTEGVHILQACEGEGGREGGREGRRVRNEKRN